METVKAVLDTLLPLVIALFVVLIPVGMIVGIVRLCTAKKIADPKKREFRKAMSWLIIMVSPLVLFILISVWGFVNIYINTLSK
jgi:hypothetical protein